MSRRQHRELDPAAVEERIGADKKRVGTLARHRREGGINLALGARVEDLNLQPETAGGGLQLAQHFLRTLRIGRIKKHGNTNGSR